MVSRESTPKEALDFLLASRLTFWNPKQILAVRILEAAEELIGTDTKCVWCDGTGEAEQDDDVGYCDRCGRECSHCCYDPKVKDTCEDCDGTGYVQRTRDEVYKLKATEIFKHVRILQEAA